MEFKPLLTNPNAIRTHSGNEVDIFRITREMFKIEDTVYSLAKETRFGGHLDDEKYYDDERVYSVLQHIVNGAELVPEKHIFAWLNHEQGEGLGLRDIAKPVKIKIQEYNTVENNLLADLAPIIGFEFPFHEEIHIADKKMLQFEWDVFMLNREPNPSDVPPSQKQHFEKHGHYYIMKKKECRAKYMELFNKYKPK